MSDDEVWNLKPGATIRRKLLHDLFGGSRQGGISPSRQSPNIFLFTDPATGEQHGYVDSWKEDGRFHYTGEGQKGDQEVKGGNRAVLEAAETSRSIRLFDGSGGDVTYVGEFELDPDRPYYQTDAPETGGGPLRSVIVFRLHPVDVRPGRPAGIPAPSDETFVDLVDPEAMNSERAFVDPSRREYEAERRESALVQRYLASLTHSGHKAGRLKIRPRGEAKPLFCDLYVEELGLLVEAKGTVDRHAVRMAIGQLMDYRRFTPAHTRCAVLLPSKPREDLLMLLSTSGISAIWEERGEFSSTGIE